MALTSTSFFAGIGGFDLAGDRLGIRATQFIEIDPSAQRALAHHFPGVPIHDDIRTYSAPLGAANVFTIGFPCVNTSNAGDRTGLEGALSGLWFESLRCIEEGQPDFVVIENPPGLINRGLRAVLGGLRMAGYCWDDPTLLSGALLGAPHQRERLFIIAYPDRRRRQTKLPPRWFGEVRALVQARRDCSRWPQFKPTNDGAVARLPAGLAHLPISVPNGQPGRMRQRILYGRSVMPDVAELVLKRVVQLAQHMDIH
jgi:DNA (cytosine-5)-methyltransferase 1